MSKGSVYVRNPTVYRIPSFRIQLDMEPLGNTCMRIHLSTVYTLLENSERFRVSSYLPASTDASRYDRSAAMAAPHSARIGPFACRRRPFSAKYFDQRLGISFTGWDPGRFDLNVQVNVSETQYLYKIILLQRH